MRGPTTARTAPSTSRVPTVCRYRTHPHAERTFNEFAVGDRVLLASTALGGASNLQAYLRDGDDDEWEEAEVGALQSGASRSLLAGPQVTHLDWVAAMVRIVTAKGHTVWLEAASPLPCPSVLRVKLGSL